VFDLLDGEAGALNRRRSTPPGMAATCEGRPDGGVEQRLHPSERSALGPDVFEEAQLATWAQHAATLAQGAGLVGNRAKHQRVDDRLNALVLSWQAIRHARDDIDRNRCPGRILQGFSAQLRFGLDGQHTGHAWRVVCEVRRFPSGPLR
jgi:hypothetical protein